MEKYCCTRHTCYLELYVIFFTKFHHLHIKRVDQRKHIHYFFGKSITYQPQKNLIFGDLCLVSINKSYIFRKVIQLSTFHILTPYSKKLCRHHILILLFDVQNSIFPEVHCNEHVISDQHYLAPAHYRITKIMYIK